MQDNLATVTRRASFSMERGSDYGDYGNSEELYAAVTFSALISQNFPERQTAAWPGPTYRWHSSHPAGLSKEGTLLGQVERYGSTEYHDNAIHLSSKFSQSFCCIFLLSRWTAWNRRSRRWSFMVESCKCPSHLLLLLMFPLTSTNKVWLEDIPFRCGDAKH